MAATLLVRSRKSTVSPELIVTEEEKAIGSAPDFLTLKSVIRGAGLGVSGYGKEKE